jgi:exonuclease V gamma subunit
MRDDPGNVEALAADDVTELFGWPVSLLDAIREISQAAVRGQIDIHGWRCRDKELRAAGPAQFPRDQLEAAHDAAVEVWLDLDDDAEVRMRRLIRRLAAARFGAPDDDQLRRELTEIDESIRTERDSGVKRPLQNKRERIVGWLLASGELDEETGLPWDYLAAYRWIPDLVLGRVSALIGVARKRALAQAPDEVAGLARRLRPDAKPDPLEIGELNQHALTMFPRSIIEAAGRGDEDAAAVAEQVLQLWEAPQTQRFLLKETARGWPEGLQQPEVGTPPVQP